MKKNMEFLLVKTDILIKSMLRLLSGGMLLYLLLLSMFSTSAVERRNFSPDTPEGEWGSYNYYLLDSCFRCLMALVIFALVIWLVNRLVRDSVWEWLERYRGILYLLFLAAGLLFIGLTQLRPISDPADLIEIADRMTRGEFPQFMPNDGYLWRNPHQMGIVLLCYWLTLLFGEQSWLAFMVLNLFALVWGLELVGGTAGLMWPEKGFRVRWSVRIAYVLFVPYFLYVTFIYGMVLSFVLSLAAMYMTLRYIREKKWSYGIPAAFFIALAVVVKPNSLIMLTAMLLFLGYDMVMEKKKLRTLAVIVMAVLFRTILLWGVDSFMSMKSGYPISDGQAMLGFVAMGLQESNFGPGAYNGLSVTLYEQAGYDTAENTRMAWESIRNTMRRFMGDKSEAVRWLGRKIAFQWNDPAFGGIDVNRNRPSAIQIPPLLDSLVHGRAGYIILGYLNVLQPVILAGSVAYFLLENRKEHRENLLLITAVIGGFIFHIFWEAKSQYVLPYFLLVIPYSVRGWECLADKMDRIYEKIKNGQSISMKKPAICVGVVAACIVSIAALYHTRIFQYMIAVQDEEELQEEYIRTAAENCGGDGFGGFVKEDIREN